MRVLGISCYYHDASAALVQDGRVLAAAEEERFTRKKHDSRFPEAAIRFCLDQAGLAPSDLDLVCFYEKPFLKLERILVTATRWADQAGSMLEEQLSQAFHERLFVDEVIRDKTGYAGPIEFCDHHMSHAASAYFLSGFEQAAILTVDGVGEWTTTAQYLGQGNQISMLREMRYPSSLGLLYSTMTAFLGFKVNNDEYKVMGLASYGRPRHQDKVRRLIQVFDDGSFCLDTDYFSFMYDPERMFNQKFVELFGPPRSPEDVITDYHKDLAASLQKVYEDLLLHLANTFYRQSGGVENLCLAGGTALNCVANARLVKETPFQRIWVPPAAGDGGGSLGAALHAYYAHGGDRPAPARFNSLLGPEYDDAEIRRMLEENGADYVRLEGDQLYEKTAELIWENQIVAWFQGRMESGPRALGCRSILANPCNPKMKDILNARVKFREEFRPFAPAVLAEEAEEFFDLDRESPFMLFAVQVKPGQGRRIPAVTHVDNTARVQTVHPEDNPRFHRLIQAFKRRSGVPVVINTSFNIRGEPIVCTPQDAYNCFLGAGIDFLVIGNYLVEKEI